mgnify:CR=1 FL=1|jgi:hypothetical protein
MTTKNTVVATGLVLWVLGVLVGAAAGEVMPGGLSIPAKLVLVVALLASLGNFAVLCRKAK